MELDRKSDAEIAEKIKRPAWTIMDYRAQTSHYTIEKLKDIVNRCAEIDFMINTGKINEDTGLELLIVELSGKNSLKIDLFMQLLCGIIFLSYIKKEAFAMKLLEDRIRRDGKVQKTFPFG